MKRLQLVLPVLIVGMAWIPGKNTQDSGRQTSLVSRVLTDYAAAKVGPHTPAAMAAAAGGFLDSLSEELREQAALAIDSKERQRWTNTPPRGNVGGVRLGDCDEKQLRCAFDLLAVTLSPQGYQKVRTIMLADDELLADGRPRAGFGAENFWLAIFGEPSAEKLWALQLDGHHLAINLTFQGTEMCMSPSFIGTQPSRYRLAGEQAEPMQGEIERAFALLGALDHEQLESAVVSDRRGGNVAAAGKDGFIPAPTGISGESLNEAQRLALMDLVNEYVANLPEPHATERREALWEEIEQMTFAWSGPTQKGSDVSYRILGPHVIIEYACQDLGGKPLDHLHSMYRDPTNEYGTAHTE